MLSYYKCLFFNFVIPSLSLLGILFLYIVRKWIIFYGHLSRNYFMFVWTMSLGTIANEKVCFLFIN